MSVRFIWIAVALPLLAACNTTVEKTAPPPAPVAQAATPQYVTSPNFRLPEGSGCSGEIARFEAVMGNDLATGHVARSVHDKVLNELSGARSACASGNSGGAISQLRAVKSRYGYP